MKYLTYKNLLFISMLVLIFALFSMQKEQLMTADAQKTFFVFASTIGLAGFGLLFVLLVRGFDFSLGTQLSLGVLVISRVLSSGGDLTFVGIGTVVAAIFMAVMIAAVFGLFNGFLVSRFKEASVLVSLAMAFLLHGFVKHYESKPMGMLPKNALENLFHTQHKWMIFPPGVWLFFLFLLLVVFVFHFTLIGRYAKAIGSNPQAAIILGIPIRKYTIYAYIICAILVAFASVFQFAAFGPGSEKLRFGFEYYTLAALLFGGVSFKNGKGNLLSVFMGVFVVSTLYISVQAHLKDAVYEQLFIGLLVLLGLLFHQINLAISSKKG